MSSQRAKSSALVAATIVVVIIVVVVVVVVVVIVAAASAATTTTITQKIIMIMMSRMMFLQQHHGRVGLNTIVLVDNNEQNTNYPENNDQALSSVLRRRRLLQADTENDKHMQQQQQQQQQINEHRDATTVDTHDGTVGSSNEPYDHPNYYAYLFVHYHKTGHHLSHQLRDLLLQASRSTTSTAAAVADTTPSILPQHPIFIASNAQEHAFKSRHHEMETGCPTHMYLPSGIISVQAAPDFFCEPEIFAEYLLRNGNNNNNNNIATGDRSSDIITTTTEETTQTHHNMKEQQQQQQQELLEEQQQFYYLPREKRGIKIIHLVRNPFTLAVSNWIYHSQYPTPESWVKTIDPCMPEFWREHESLATMTSSTLLSGVHPILQYQDFDTLHSLCTSLFRSDSISQDWSYYTHLRHLDPPTDSLSLSTIHMMIQGISGGDILRMANNIIKLQQVQQLEERIRLSRHDISSSSSASSSSSGQSSSSTAVPKMIQVLTMSMDEFMNQPGQSALRILDFAFHDTVSREVKEELAIQYELSYKEKLNDAGEVHITANRVVTNGQEMDLVGRKREWIDYLRRHELFGRILEKIELLVDHALEGGL